MGAAQSNDTLHCNRFLDGKGPPSLTDQAVDGLNGKYGSGAEQPRGQMTWEVLHAALPEFPQSNTLQVHFSFAEGTQAAGHPHPGRPYPARHLGCVLPDSADGRKLLKLLEKAFTEQLLFTVATATDGRDQVTAAVPLRTQDAEGDTPSAELPDRDYMKHVTKLLKDRGVY